MQQLTNCMKGLTKSPGCEVASSLELLDSCLVAAASGNPLPANVASRVERVADMLWGCMDWHGWAGLSNASRHEAPASSGRDSSSAATAGMRKAQPARAAQPVPDAQQHYQRQPLKPFGRHLCWYPECPTFSGASEADVPMERCSACKVARYCGRACQAAHWKAGHKQECSKDSGSTGGVGGA